MRLGCFVATIAMSVLKQIDHSWMVEIFFFGRTFSDFPRRSKTVGSGAPRCAVWYADDLLEHLLLAVEEECRKRIVDCWRETAIQPMTGSLGPLRVNLP